MGSLYDRADIYDLFYDDTSFKMVQRHWDTLLQGKNIKSFHDISIGTGSLTLSLCELGVTVSGSDLSESMLHNCDLNAKKRGYSVDLVQCDFRKLTEKMQTTYDCVGSTGNSLPYVTNDEVLMVLEQMDALIKKGGYLYYDIRNWDKILSDRERFYTYNPKFHEDTRINIVQAWDYNADDSMTFNILYTFERDNKIVQKEIFEEHYYPVRMQLLLDKIKQMGYQKIEVLTHPAYATGIKPEDADWYCVIAQKQ